MPVAVLFPAPALPSPPPPPSLSSLSFADPNPKKTTESCLSQANRAAWRPSCGSSAVPPSALPASDDEAGTAVTAASTSAAVPLLALRLSLLVEATP